MTKSNTGLLAWGDIPAVTRPLGLAWSCVRQQHHRSHRHLGSRPRVKGDIVISQWDNGLLFTCLQ